MQAGHAVLQDEEPALQIEVGQHVTHQPGIVGRVHLLQHVQQLLAPHGQGVAVHRINRQVRRQQIELWSGAGIMLGAHDHGDGRGIEMEQRMDAGLAGDDGHGAPGLQQLDVSHAHVSHLQMRSDGAAVVEVVERMNAGSMHHMKRAGELVLMDVGGAFHPEQQLNVEARMFIRDDLRLAEAGLRLQRLLVVEQELAHQRRQLHVL